MKPGDEEWEAIWSCSAPSSSEAPITFSRGIEPLGTIVLGSKYCNIGFGFEDKIKYRRFQFLTKAPCFTNQPRFTITSCLSTEADEEEDEEEPDDESEGEEEREDDPAAYLPPELGSELSLPTNFEKNIVIRFVFRDGDPADDDFHSLVPMAFGSDRGISRGEHGESEVFGEEESSEELEEAS